jgi:hypothetical protein
MKLRTATLATLLAQLLLVDEAWGHPGHGDETSVLTSPIELILLFGLLGLLGFGVRLARRRPFV